MGFAPPQQATVIAEHPAFEEEFTTHLIQRDLDLSNKWLDEIGLDSRDSDGYRLFPSGNELTLILSPRGTEGISVEMSELIKRQLDDVGLRVLVRTAESALWTERLNAGKIQMTVWAVMGGGDPLATPASFFPVCATGSHWCLL
ncbi:MAG: ABC transporter substrate-binding protein [Clostridiales bacterium]|nr:ABC transporter substrate-binding protein [Clostridiales bacterium]